MPIKKLRYSKSFPKDQFPTQIVKKKSLTADHIILNHFQAKGDHMRARAGLHNGVQQQRDKNGMLCRVRKIFFLIFFYFHFSIRKLFHSLFFNNNDDWWLCPKGINGMLCMERFIFSPTVSQLFWLPFGCCLKDFKFVFQIVMMID